LGAGGEISGGQDVKPAAGYPPVGQRPGRPSECVD
jgi:hypothetical protein